MISLRYALSLTSPTTFHKLRWHVTSLLFHLTCRLVNTASALHNIYARNWGTTPSSWYAHLIFLFLSPTSGFKGVKFRHIAEIQHIIAQRFCSASCWEHLTGRISVGKLSVSLRLERHTLQSALVLQKRTSV